MDNLLQTSSFEVSRFSKAIGDFGGKNYKFDFSKCFCDFSLIIIIYLFLTYPIEMDNFSHSILGKFCAAILIAYYTVQNIMYGLLFCIVVIYYYQKHHTSHIFTSHFENFADYQDSSVEQEINTQITPTETEEYLHKNPPNSNNTPCNNGMCKYSISNQKLRTEDEIVKPKNSNEWFSEIIHKFM